MVGIFGDDNIIWSSEYYVHTVNQNSLEVLLQQNSRYLVHILIHSLPYSFIYGVDRVMELFILGCGMRGSLWGFLNWYNIYHYFPYYLIWKDGGAEGNHMVCAYVMRSTEVLLSLPGSCVAKMTTRVFTLPDCLKRKFPIFHYDCGRQLHP
jgi:hypothetical protein